MAHYHRKRYLRAGPVVFAPVGCELQAHEREMLAHPAVGGVVLAAHHVEEKQQLADLIRCCREARHGELVLMVEQSSDSTRRLCDAFSLPPSAALLATANDFDSARTLSAIEDVGWLLARELADVGLDMNIHLLGDLGATSVGSAALNRAAIRGMQCAGLSTLAKHFPSAAGEFDDQVASDDREFSEIREKDLSVFAALIDAQVDAIMPSTRVYPALDESAAVYSETWLQEQLRATLGFTGAVLSADISVLAEEDQSSVSARAKCALDAGCDMALVRQLPEQAEAVIDSLSGEAVDADRAERVEALRREPDVVDEHEWRERAARSFAWLAQFDPSHE